MTPISKELVGKELFQRQFEALEARLVEHSPSWLAEKRRRAIARFKELGIPTKRWEMWRFTNIQPLTEIHFEPVAADETRIPIKASVLSYFDLHEGDDYRAVFVNGQLSPEYSRLEGLPQGVVIAPLTAALTSHESLVQKHLGEYSGRRDNPFAELNLALHEDGAFIHVPRGVEVDKPIHLIFLARGGERTLAMHPRNLFVFGEGCSSQIVESYDGLDGSTYFNNVVTEAVLEQNAQVDHYKIQLESQQAVHLQTFELEQERDSRFSTHSITLGGRLGRNDIGSYLDGENVETVFNGLYMLTADQDMSTYTYLDHAQPHCNSHELYKGILNGKAHAAFNGRIHVHPDAQKTDSIQSSQHLLLAPTATVNAQPQLEIYADDVKCTHGATIGQLDKDALFYLQTRGMSEREAHALMTYGFANAILEEVRSDAVREHLSKLIANWLKEHGTPEV